MVMNTVIKVTTIVAEKSKIKSSNNNNGGLIYHFNLPFAPQPRPVYIKPG